MKEIILKLISEEEYRSDIISTRLFEDEHSLSFSRIVVENSSLKFAWNSKEINPGVHLIEDTSVIFVGVDTYVVGYNYKNKMISFFLNTGTNFKWFDVIENGIAIVTETGVILINATILCTLRGCFFYGDIIMGTEIEKNKMRISFLDNEDKLLNI